MGRGIPPRKRLQIIQLFIRGLSYDQISQQAGVAKGSVANVIDELRSGQHPSLDLTEEIDLIRDLVVTIRRLDLDPSKAVVGLAFFQRLRDLAVEPPELERFIKLWHYLRPAETAAREFTEAAMHLHQLVEKTGRGYEDLVVEYDRLTARYAALRRDADSLKAECTKLENRAKAEQEKVGRLQQERAELERQLTLLNEHVKQQREAVAIADKAVKGLSKQAADLQKQIRTSRNEAGALEKAIATRTATLGELESIGIDVADLRRYEVHMQALAARTGVDGTQLVKRLLDGMEELEGVLRLEDECERLKARAAGLNSVIDEVQVEKRALAGEIAALQREKAELEAHIRSLKMAAVKDLNDLTAAARDGIAKTSRAAREGVEQATHDVRRLAKRAAEVGEQIGGLQGTVSSLRWVGLLQRFLIDPASLTPEEWGELVPLLIPALKAGIEQHSPAIPSAKLLLKILSRLPEQLDGGPK